MKRFVKYRNGNYDVFFNTKTGTKIRENDEDFFYAEFPESCDLTITSVCDGGCSFCYQGCTLNGVHADILSPAFLDTLRPYTELAINGNDLSHPNLVEFLYKMKDKNIIVNMTVNQMHFMRKLGFIKQLIDDRLIYGLGVSLVSVSDEFIKTVKQFPNAVIHVVNGIVHPSQLEQLAHNGLKILILGYKRLCRGETMYQTQGNVIEEVKSQLYDILPTIINEHWFEVVSFDNLALKQLDAKRLLSQEEWDEFYMGDDGQDGDMSSASMYIDLVNREYARNSTCTERYPLEDDIVTMFDKLRGEYEA